MEIMEYLCHTEQLGRMMAATIRIECQSKQQGIGEYVNLSSMAKKKV